MLLAELLVRLGLKNDLGPGLDKSKSQMDDWTKSMKAKGQELTTKVTLPIVGAFAMMVNSASDLNEATTAVAATFGSSSDKIMKASENSATAVGLSKQQYLDGSKSLGVYAKAAGLSGDEMANFSIETIKAAADLASFHNANPEDVMQAIKSGLTGETEALKKYGILINETTMKQKAMEMGLVDANGEISEQNKVLVRQQLIMDGVGPAADDFAETQGGLANQMRIAKAEMMDLSAELGTVLLPYVLKGVQYLRKFMKFTMSLSDRQKKWVVILMAVAAAIGPVLIGISMMIPAISALAGAFALLTWPIALVVLALVGLGVAYKTNFLGFADAVNWVAKAVWNGVQPIIKFIGLLVEAYKSGKPVKELLKEIPGPLQGIAKQFLIVADSIGDLVAAFQSGGLKGLLKQIPEELKTIAKAFFNFQKEVYKLLFEGLKAAFPYVIEFFKKIPGWIKDAIGYLYPLLRPAAAALWDGFKKRLSEKWAQIREWLNDRKPAIVSAFGTASSFLVQKAKDLIQGFKDTVTEKWATVREWLNGRGTAIRNAIGDTYHDLIQKGKDLIQGLRDGAVAMFGVTGGGPSHLLGWIERIPGKLLDAIVTAISAVASKIKGAGSSVISKFKEGALGFWSDPAGGSGGALGWFKSLPGKAATAIVDAVVAAYNRVVQAGRDIINAFISGAKEIWDKRPGWLKGIMGAGSAIIGGSDEPSPASRSVSASSMMSASVSPGSQITIVIDGYNRDPEELANSMVTVLNRELRLAGGFG